MLIGFGPSAVASKCTKNGNCEGSASEGSVMLKNSAVAANTTVVAWVDRRKGVMTSRVSLHDLDRRRRLLSGKHRSGVQASSGEEEIRARILAFPIHCAAGKQLIQPPPGVPGQPRPLTSPAPFAHPFSSLVAHEILVFARSFFEYACCAPDTNAVPPPRRCRGMTSLCRYHALADPYVPANTGMGQTWERL